MMANFRELVTAFRQLDIDPSRPVIAHASLSAFGHVQGGAETLLGALLSQFNTLIMPAFTYKTMLVPETGPENNAMIYGSGRDHNFMAEFYRPSMPVDRLMGALSEALRCHPKAQRTSHPILSFTGINTARPLECQTLEEPLGVIGALVEAGGWVLLLGVDHTVNTSIHYGERLAGRKQFVRWALTPRGAVECPGFPGCSDGFQAVAPRIAGLTRRVQVGPAAVQAVPLIELTEIVQSMVAADLLALLCDRDYCERCDATRAAVLSLSREKTK